MLQNINMVQGAAYGRGKAFVDIIIHIKLGTPANWLRVDDLHYRRLPKAALVVRHGAQFLRLHSPLDVAQNMGHPVHNSIFF